MNTILKIAADVYRACGVWLMGGIALAAAVGWAVILLFSRRRAALYCGVYLAVCGFVLGAALCAAEAAGQQPAVKMFGWLYAALAVCLWLASWLIARRRRRAKIKAREVVRARAAALNAYFDRAGETDGLAVFAPEKVGERVRQVENPLCAAPAECDDGNANGDAAFGKEHALHLIALLRAAPLSVADAREVDSAERAVLGSEGGERLNQALGGLVRLVARYGV